MNATLKISLTLLLLTIGTQLFGQDTTRTDRSPLFKQVMNADSIFFQSMNNCDLKTYESFLTEDFEFYHDKGGLTKSRDTEMKSMASFCGEQRKRQKLRRELIRESIEISPVKDFGAIETGRHLFYLVIDNTTEKLIEEARFTNIWQRQASGWKLSRVISYEHTPVSNINLADKVLDQYVGEYKMSKDKTIVITRNQKLLKAKDGDWSADLHPESISKFYLNYGNTQFGFVRGQKGSPTKLIIYENGKQVESGVRKDK
ncbi:MAG: nuclear transport factor 2 family protein [Cyclobacteriaceae bacterium]|nr:nuclear transport factor 2 family protein [Cyclobacteriaceae bacterium]